MLTHLVHVRQLRRPPRKVRLRRLRTLMRRDIIRPPFPRRSIIRNRLRRSPHGRALEPLMQAPTRDQFTQGRIMGATAALVIDWGVAHADTPSKIPYAMISQALRVRYPNNVLPSTSPGNALSLK